VGSNKQKRASPLLAHPAPLESPALPALRFRPALARQEQRSLLASPSFALALALAPLTVLCSALFHNGFLDPFRTRTSNRFVGLCNPKSGSGLAVVRAVTFFQAQREIRAFFVNKITCLKTSSSAQRVNFLVYDNGNLFAVCRRGERRLKRPNTF